MLFKLRLTLRQKIVLYCLIVLSPVVLLTYFLVEENSSFVKQQRLDGMTGQATVVQLAIDELIDSWVRFLDNLAQTPAVKSKDAAASHQIFASVFPLYPDFFLSLGMTDEHGRVLAGVQRIDSPSLTSLNVGDRAYFQEVMRTGKPVISGRLIGRATNQPVFVIAVPVRDDAGRVTGTVAAGVSLRQIGELLQRLGYRAGDAIVVDSDGVVLSHPDWQYVDAETNLRSLAPIPLALAGRQGTAEYADPLEGNIWLWAYRPLARTNWAVAVKYPETAVEAPVYTSLLRWSFYLVVAVALALILASFSAERIARPLRRLSRLMAAAVPAGAVVEPMRASLDELHQLTRVFNQICASLSQTSDELAGVKGELAAQAEKLEIMTQRALEAREEERRLISMNIHDGVLQLIAAAQMEARLARTASPLSEASTERLGQVERILEQALGELRGIAHGHHPPALAEVGLVSAIYHHLIVLREAYGIPRATLHTAGDPYRLREDTESAAFRIVQESLANAAKHARASTVEVHVDFDPGRLRLVVADDGKGFNLRDVDARLRPRHGLANMRERAASLGGICTILSMPEGGTRVEVEIPLGGVAGDQSVVAAGVKG